MLSTAPMGSSRNRSLTKFANHTRVPTFAVDNVRLIALADAQRGCTCVIEAAAAYSRRFYPRSSLGRCA